MTVFTAAVVQFQANGDPADNLARLLPLLREAAGKADYVQTPEMTNLLGGTAQVAMAVSFEHDATLARVRTLAKETATWIHLGSIAVRAGDGRAGDGQARDGRLANRSVLIGPDGAVAAVYDKIHLFDVDLTGPNARRVRESERYAPGADIVAADMALTGGTVRLGLTVCFDLRFPVLYRRLAQADATVMAVPSAFFAQTGAKHWEPLLRARAIETGSFVIAAAQHGRHENGRESHGHSLIVSPDGAVLAERAEGEGVVTAQIDTDEAEACRRAIPVLHDSPALDGAPVLHDASTADAAMPGRAMAGARS